MKTLQEKCEYKQNKQSCELDSIGTDDLIIDERISRFATVASRNASIACVISGETGTGKEEFAKLVHKRRVYQEGPIPLVSVNCANVNGDLALSLLFGHAKGAFSGADKATVGFVGEANGGILFLDEIHALAIPTQQKLLRVINDGTYTRLGDTRLLKSNFQIIAATTKDLDQEVEEGRFIIDLRARLYGIDIMLSPLRERKQDIPDFIRLFFKKQQLAVSDEIVKHIAAKCLDYYWQGNIRQLFSTLRAWQAISEGTFDLATFPDYKSLQPPENNGLSTIKSESNMDEIIDIVERSILLEAPLEEALDKVEKYILLRSLELSNSITEVYRGLRISRNTFYVKRKKHGLEGDLSRQDYMAQVG